MRRLRLLVLLALTACGRTVAEPRPEWRITIATDAPLPQFGDRLLVEVLDENGVACSGCRREFGIDPSTWPLSIGVVPTGNGSQRVHVLVYRAILTGPEGPTSNRHLDMLARLPETSTLVDVAITLPMKCFGVLADVERDASCDPASGELAATPTLAARTAADLAALPRPGSWPAAAPVACAEPAEPGMVCIPGGAFLLGGPLYLPTGDTAPVPEQLVRVGAFALDVDEFRVGALRELVAQGAVQAPVAKGSGVAEFCSYLGRSPANDAWAVNCLSAASAAAACAAMGKRLPTEAEWEWAAGNLHEESDLPAGAFGSAASVCSVAAVGRGVVGGAVQSFVCMQNGDDPGPRQAGNPLDVTRLGVRNLAGNLDEWVDGTFVPYTDPACWGSDLVLHEDPQCHVGVVTAVRGASWALAPYAARATFRNGNPGGPPSAYTGFRCAK